MNITNIIRGSSTFYYLCVAVVSVYWKLLSPKQIPYMQTYLYIYIYIYICIYIYIIKLFLNLILIIW